MNIKLLKPCESIRDWADAQFPHKLNLTLQDNSVPQYNFRCHVNAVQAVKTGLAVGVVETVIIYEKKAVAHYISLMADGTFVDFTLGVDSLTEDVRLVRMVHPDEWDRPHKMLGNLKLRLTEHLPWITKKLIDRMDLC